MNVEHEFPKRFITSTDVDDSPKAVVLRINSVKAETVGMGAAAKRKLVLTFRGTVKELALSISNRDMLASVLGPETDNWVGQRIELGCVDATFEGRKVRSIRIKDVFGDIAPSKLVVMPDEEEPATTMHYGQETVRVDRSRPVTLPDVGWVGNGH